jgi:alpha,alpha-trehalase
MPCPRVARWPGIALAALSIGAATCHADTRPQPWPATPDKVYGELFVAVQSQQVYADQKAFVDAIPDGEPVAIVREYQARKDQEGFSLRSFVAEHFTEATEPAIAPPPGQALRAHIDWLWPALTRTTISVPPHSSLLPLPRPYVVPGGRFREGYYWDSWFTMLGLQASGHEDLVDGMLANFAYQIDTWGHVPNGNRSYYLSRSQPPFFALMVELAAQREGDAPYKRYLPALRKEYAYWMQGAAGLHRGQAAAHVVRLHDGTVLNRYWDAEATPRPESWLQDVTTAKAAPDRDSAGLWRELRAAAESGWDFSSRWLGDDATLATIRTTSIVPVDLNSLLYQLERTIAKACTVQRDLACANAFTRHARERALAIDRVLWHPDGYYADYDWQQRRPRDNRTAAMLYPLFVGLAPANHADATLRTAQASLLQVGGLATTTFAAGQQWDTPNGWAPLQWIAIEAATRYHRPDLADTIAARFLRDVQALYDAKHKLVEKYLVDGSGIGGGGGEYALQDGFGWTNGVTLKLLDRAASAASAPSR